MKLGSLFDGSGGFPLAGILYGIEPVWASEVEPYPIAVTKEKFPKMKHLGDINTINGGMIEPVDVITFGSPCQDLSVAGRRAGLVGDRSGLFMQAIRIIKEMRDATNGLYPRFAIWENVPGAFSSNNGEDFRVVLEQFIKIKEPEAPTLPMPEKNKWAYADCLLGDGWSIAYRVFDAQYWGVPQRRRRIYLVADFGGRSAGEILFKRQGLRRYFAEGRTPWQGTTTDAERGITADDRERSGVESLASTICIIDSIGGQAERGWESKIAPTLKATHYKFPPSVAMEFNEGKADSIENHPADSRVNIDKSGKVQTLTGRMGTGGGNVPLVLCIATQQGGAEIAENLCPTITAAAYAMQGFGDYKESEISSGLKARDYKDATDLVLECAGVDCRNMNEYPELYPTLQAKPNGGQSLNFSGAVRVKYIVRRLTPIECARLQGFPDWWGKIMKKEILTAEEYDFWLNVRSTWATINGKQVKDWTEKQMLKWYKKLHTDSAEYKMWGNGIALPCAAFVMEGIADVKEEKTATHQA